MDFDVLVVFKAGIDHVFLPFNKLVDFNSIKDFAVKRWGSFDGSVSLSYTIGDYKDSRLDNESDFTTIKWILERGKYDKMDICVSDKRACLPYTVSSRSAVQLIQPAPIQSSPEPFISDPPPSFFTHEVKDLRSDSWKSGLQYKGQCFMDGAEQFRLTLCKQAAVEGFEFDFIHNNKSRISAQCFYKVSKGCKWYVYVSPEKFNAFWYVRTYRPTHTCGHVYKKMSSDRLDSSVLSHVISDEVHANPSLRPREIQFILKESYGFDISYKTSWGTVNKAKDHLFGDIDSSFNRLQTYFEKLKALDPDTAFSVECDPVSRVFHRCFFAFGGSLAGFGSCRPMLFLDGTFLKSKYKGMLVVATAKDGNQGLFPVAFGVVPGEDTVSWTGFLEFLKPLVSGRPLTFISDRNKGLLNAVKSVFPNESHSFCTKHIEKNIRVSVKGSTFFKDRMVHLMNTVARAPTTQHYDHFMAIWLLEGKQKIIDFLSSLPKENYANAHFPGRRYGEMTSNAVESFNYWILEQRSLPISQLIDALRVKLMQWYHDRSLTSSKWTTPLCPSIMTLYNTNVGLSSTWAVKQSTLNLYQVGSNPVMVVDIVARTCSCCSWQELGFPCQHAICALSSAGVVNPFEYVESYFHVDSYRKSYAKNIPPMSTFEVAVPLDDSVIIHPPPCRVPPGRPQSKRHRSFTEKLVRLMRCGRCRKIGTHNRSTCRAAI